MSLFDIIGAVSGGLVTLVVGGITYLVHRRAARTAERDEARDEAMELAHVRGERIVDLVSRIEDLERTTKELQRELHASAEAARQANRAFARALRDLLRSIERELDENPPDVAGAKLLIREAIGNAA